MHRAEKSSSKICRNREVERAQELHRKKIDGVKSYLTAITKPTSERSPTVFRRKLPTSSEVATSSSMVLHKDPISDSCQSIGSPPSSLGMDMDNYSDSYCDEFETSSVAMDKLDEFRVVTTVDPKRYVHAKVPPRASTHGKTLNGSFRTRRLKQIQVDNVGLFQRIRNSAAHYRNDDLRRDWDQNISYLTSICEFPLTKECVVNQSYLQCPPQSANDGMDDFAGWRPTIKTPVHLPEMVHPIKSISTSPKRLHLNLSPAFRSLRKAMPQQPSLPPITSPNRLTTSIGNLDGVLSSNTSSSKIPPHNVSDVHAMTASTSKPIGNNGSRTSRHVLFEGDGATTSPAALDDSSIAKLGLEVTKYQLLRTGRFVGGTYLILTVFCGHGITNPYGFDVHALHPESQYEYRLNITKEMTHQLLDTISSSSLAAVTAAAAGTNLSMEQIAQNICDHVNFSSLESNLGELIFLVSTLGGSKDRVLLIDCDTSCMSFCLHHLVELENITITNPLDTNDSSPRKRRKMHVNVTTRPPKCCTASMTLIPPAPGDSGGTVICFQLLDDSSTASSQRECFDAQVEVELDELYRVVGQASERSRFSRFAERPGDRARATVSLERIVSAAIRHLHIVVVPTGADTPDDHKEVLIFNQYVNEKLHLTGKTSIPRVFSQPMLSKTHPTQSSGSLTLPRESDASLLLESGLVWKSMYFLTRIHVDSGTESSRWRTISSIHDLGGSMALHVFNSQSGQHSSRTLACDQVQAFARKLAGETNANHWMLLDFAKRILERMHVDVDLFGHEILTFPGLEPPKAARSDTGAASPRSRYHRDRSNGGIDALCEPVTPAGATHSNHVHADDSQAAGDMRALNQDSFSEAEDSEGAFEPEEDDGDEQEAVDGVGRHQTQEDNSLALVSRRRRQGQKRSTGFGLRMQDAWLTIGPLGQLHS